MSDQLTPPEEPQSTPSGSVTEDEERSATVGKLVIAGLAITAAVLAGAGLAATVQNKGGAASEAPAVEPQPAVTINPEGLGPSELPPDPLAPVENPFLKPGSEQNTAYQAFQNTALSLLPKDAKIGTDALVEGIGIKAPIAFAEVPGATTARATARGVIDGLPEGWTTPVAEPQCTSFTGLMFSSTPYGGATLVFNSTDSQLCTMQVTDPDGNNYMLNTMSASGQPAEADLEVSSDPARGSVVFKVPAEGGAWVYMSPMTEEAAAPSDQSAAPETPATATPLPEPTQMAPSGEASQ